MKARVFAAATAAVLLSTASFADCVYPKAPASAPNGNTATEAEMISAMQALKKYNADIEAYLKCNDEETQKRMTEAGADPEKAKQLKEVAEKKRVAAVDELQARADEFNTQLKAYKSKSKSN